MKEKRKTHRKAGAQSGNKFAWGNDGGGRSKYRSSYADIAHKLCLLGHTDKELAAVFGVSEVTINAWKKEHADFFAALKTGKELADSNVVHSLYQRAVGFEHDSEEIKVIDSKVERVPIRKIYPPDVLAAKFWLTNRQKDKWRDKQELQIDFEKLTDEQLNELISKVIKVSSNA